jgi:hypothetical protein
MNLKVSWTEILGWTGLGYTDSRALRAWDNGSCCIVVDFDITKSSEEEFKEHRICDYTRIYKMDDE